MAVAAREAAGRRLHAIDRWTLAYVAFAAAVLLWRWPDALSSRGLLLGAHGALAGVALLAPRLRERGGVPAFLAEFYPLIVVVGLYSAIGLLNTAVGVSHDARVQGWEEAVFGFQPSRAWIRAQPSPGLSWLLHVGYLSYYFILAGAPLGLWASRRRGAARHVLVLMMATFYLCYVVFLLFPVAGPRYLFPRADNAATATAAARFAQKLLDRGAAWGTAFPSSHVAVAFVASIEAGRQWRPLGAILVPAAVLLALGTVYGQFHYAVDAVAGAGVAAAVLLLAGRRVHTV